MSRRMFAGAGGGRRGLCGCVATAKALACARRGRRVQAQSYVPSPTHADGSPHRRSETLSLFWLTPETGQCAPNVNDILNNTQNNAPCYQFKPSDPGGSLHFDAKAEGISESAPDHRFDQRLQKVHAEMGGRVQQRSVVL